LLYNNSKYVPYVYLLGLSVVCRSEQFLEGAVNVMDRGKDGLIVLDRHVIKS